MIASDGSLVLDAPLQINLTGSLEPAQAILENCTIQEMAQEDAPHTALTVKGLYDLVNSANTQVRIRAETPSLARWRALLPGLPALKNVKATIAAQGPFEKPDFSYALQCDPEQILEGTATLDFSGADMAAKANATAKGIETQNFAENIPGNASAKIKATMTGFWPECGLKAEMEILSSQVLSYAIRGGKASLDYDKTGVARLTLAANINEADLNIQAQGIAKGLFNDADPLDMDIQAAIANANPRKLAFDSRVPSGDLNLTLDGKAEKRKTAPLANTQISFTANFEPSQLEQVTINSATIAAKISENGVLITDARMSGLAGKLALSGHVDYSAKGTLKASAKITDLTGLSSLFLDEPVKGTAHLSLTAQGDLADPDIQGRVKMNVPDFSGLSKQFLKTSVKGSANVELEARGKLANPVIEGRIQAALPDLSTLAALYLEDPIQGQANLDVVVKGPAQNPVLQGKVALRNVQYLEYGFAQGSFEARAKLEPMNANIKGEAGNLGFAGQSLEALTLDVTLNQDNITFFFAGQGGVVDSLETKGSLAGYQQPEKILTLETMEVVWQDRKVAIQQPATVHILPASLNIPGLKLACEGQVLEVQGNYHFDGSLSAQANMPNLDLSRLPQALERPMLLNGTGEAGLTVTGTLERPVADIKIAAHNVSIDKDLPGVSLLASAAYKNGIATLDADLTPESGGKMEAMAKCPMELGLPLKDNFLPQSGLQASIKGQGLDLSFIPQWVDSLDALDGILDLDATATGNPRSPILRGTASLSSDRLVLQDWEDPITDLKARLDWTPTLVTITDISARTQAEGECHGSGTIALDNLKPTNFDLAFQTRKLDLSYWSMFTARADSDLKLKGLWPEIDLVGSVNVGKGEFRLDRFMATRRRQVSVEKDVHIVGEEIKEEDSPLEPVGLDLKVTISGPMWIRGEGAQIEMGGDLHVAKQRNTSVVSTKGYLETKRGVYEFRSKNFDVDKGRVDFVGGYPPDPILDIIASYKVAGVTIYLEIGGTPSSMTITLSADPALDQTDIASLLIFGKKSSDLSSGESKSLEEQGAALLAAKAMDELKRAVGADVPVDMLSVRSNGQGSGQDIVVGKYLSPKLFITYKRGISSQGGNEVQLEYQLTPKISVESQVGDSESGVDLFWNYDY